MKVEERQEIKDVVKKENKPFIVLCTSGLGNPANARSALMFSAIAATMGCRTVLYMVQDGVGLMVRGAVERETGVKPGKPTLKQRLEEAIEAGVEFQVCSQSCANKGICQDDLIPQARITGAATLVDLSLDSSGFLAF
jgi:predicted peroxiredoxin